MPSLPQAAQQSPLRRLSTQAGEQLEILDQTLLPWRKAWRPLSTLADTEHAILDMQVRGAPLIGVIAAYGLALGLQKDASDNALNAISARLAATRPTAVNLGWALTRACERLRPLPVGERVAAAWREADAIAREDADNNQAIGAHGLKLLQYLADRHPDRPLQLMTHCNAGWLATAGYGTALAPIYAARHAGLSMHVWVSETRPRNQGLLTAWELLEAGVPHTLIADNAAGLLILQGRVDAIIVGADRIAANGDVANKVGTSLKALAAAHQCLPFYVAAPTSTLDFSAVSGDDIPIETRSDHELRFVAGVDCNTRIGRLCQIAEGHSVYNPAFDITPAALVTLIITERGVSPANEPALARLSRNPATTDT
ncbi:MAG: S-methyl-5-thioribose-1-phosphate isomerase [Zoogloeaceae bacterium]|jgi:methylthioribose-1-phosphate isomerase|nr:S-methyl-5-thioribose-1-phosphate isomerase [Zoogloeaceae bacterium]